MLLVSQDHQQGTSFPLSSQTNEAIWQSDGGAVPACVTPCLRVHTFDFCPAAGLIPLSTDLLMCNTNKLPPFPALTRRWLLGQCKNTLGAPAHGMGLG